jgi:DNA-binding MurR/RpiR family transcriptional regulator
MNPRRATCQRKLQQTLKTYSNMQRAVKSREARGVQRMLQAGLPRGGSRGIVRGWTAAECEGGPLNVMKRKSNPASSDGDGREEVPASLEARFAQGQHLLNERRKGLVQAILDSPGETYFLSSRELAKRYSVDAATIVRTVQALGYDRFADFAADLRRHFVTRITPYAAMRAAAKKKESIADYIHHSLDKDLENLNLLRSTLDADRMIEFAKQAHRSRRILVVGIDFAASLAWALAYGLVRLGLDAETPTGSSGNVQHKVRVLTKHDLLVAISFGKGLRDTVEAALQARERGVPTFGITDGNTTPIARFCDAHVVATTARASFIDSYAAPMAAINALLVACAHIHPERSLALLRQADDEYGSGPRWYKDPTRQRGSSTFRKTAARRANTKP